MGQSWGRCPSEVGSHVASFLIGTEARMALDVAKLQAMSSDAIYLTLARKLTSFSKPLRMSIREARRGAIEAGRSPRELFWAVQRLVCERCSEQPSCTRGRCGRCAHGRRPRALRGGGLDICCSCAAFFMRREEAEARQEQIRLAYAAWQRNADLEAKRGYLSQLDRRGARQPEVALPSGRVLRTPRAPGRGRAYVRPPRPPNVVCGGMLVHERQFEEEVAKFWASVESARRQRRAALGRLLAPAPGAAGLGPEALRLCAECLLKPSAPVSELAPKLWLWRAAQAVLDRWEAVPLGDEDGFFTLEKEILALCHRALALLQKFERLDCARFRNALKRATGDESHEEGMLGTETERLDAVCELLTGSSATGRTTTPQYVRRRIGCSLLNSLGLPGLALCEAEASALAGRLEAAGEFELVQCAWGLFPADLTDRYYGLTVGEVWCGDPDACRRRVPRQRPLREQLEEFCEGVLKFDEGRSAAIVAMSASIGVEDFWEHD